MLHIRKSLVVLMLLSTNFLAHAESPAVCADAPKLQSQIFETALRNLLSLGYVHKAIESESGPDVQFCTQAVILGQNIYKYGLFLIQIEVQNKTTRHSSRKFHFLYQDSSTQANHNLKFLNWTALSTDSFVQTTNHLFEESVFQERQIEGLKDPEDIIAVVEKTNYFVQTSVDPSSLSSMKLDQKTYLVTWLSQANTSFSVTPQLFGVIVRKQENNKYALSFNKFLYSDYKKPILEAVERAEQGLSQSEAEDPELVAEYLRSISPVHGQDLRIVEENNKNLEILRDKIVAVSSMGRSGSGVLLDVLSREPKVITNFHVAGNARAAVARDQVRWKGQWLKVKSKKCNAYHDLCVLGLDSQDVKALLSENTKELPIALTASLKKGDQLTYSGYRMFTPIWSKAHLEHLFQMNEAKIGNSLDNGFVEGMSGGGVLTADGKLAGIIAFKAKTPGGTSYFFLPTEWVLQLIESPESDLDPLLPFYAKNDQNVMPFPQFVDLNFNLMAGQFDQLIPKAQQWLKDQPGHPDALYYLGAAGK